MVRFVLISDTHNTTPDLPDGDVLIHAGDLTIRGSIEEFQEAEKWFKSLKNKFKRIYYTPGNHDWLAFSDERVVRYDILKTPNWLVDMEVYTLENIRIYGCPWVQSIAGANHWAYPLYGGSHNKEKWLEIPEGLDILVTHGPPYNILDKHWHTGSLLGDSYLRCRLKEMLSPPKLHIFGHIHAFGGLSQEEDGTLFINASVCDEDYTPTNKITVLDYSPGSSPVISYEV